MNDGKLTVMYVVQETGDMYLLFVHIDDLSFKKDWKEKKLPRSFFVRDYLTLGHT